MVVVVVEPVEFSAMSDKLAPMEVLMATPQAL